MAVDISPVVWPMLCTAANRSRWCAWWAGFASLALSMNVSTEVCVRELSDSATTDSGRSLRPDLEIPYLAHMLPWPPPAKVLRRGCPNNHSGICLEGKVLKMVQGSLHSDSFPSSPRIYLTLPL
ncbi:hypothetical protein GQ53DRAFT_438952 [Thozetella sp. PMI_491]|nr:hypothetical protein GQ53DRAFT_438952 [Thozetella sp. PMI_491]